MPKINSTITVFIDGRHDFQRKAKVLNIRGDELLVHYFEYSNLSKEWIPKHWL